MATIRLLLLRAAGAAALAAALAAAAAAAAAAAGADAPPAQVPRRRFGRTDISMPVFTMGGMRMQQSWGRGDAADITHMSEVDPDCQDNFVAILRRALSHGINHFETARGYGCSELQYGDALRQLFESGVKREDLILQTKVSPFATPEEFRETLDLSLSLLGVEYIDLFSFHGINTEQCAHCSAFVPFGALPNSTIPLGSTTEPFTALPSFGCPTEPFAVAWLAGSWSGRCARAAAWRWPRSTRPKASCAGSASPRTA